MNGYGKLDPKGPSTIYTIDLESLDFPITVLSNMKGCLPDGYVFLILQLNLDQMVPLTLI
jgi:hypothetical protein